MFPPPQQRGFIPLLQVKTISLDESLVNGAYSFAVGLRPGTPTNKATPPAALSSIIQKNAKRGEHEPPSRDCNDRGADGRHCALLGTTQPNCSACPAARPGHGACLPVFVDLYKHFHTPHGVRASRLGSGARSGFHGESSRRPAWHLYERATAGRNPTADPDRYS